MGLEIKFAVLIFPLGGGKQRFDDVPMLGNLTVFYSEKIVESNFLAGETPFANHEDKVSLSKHLVNADVGHCDIVLGHCLQRCTQSGESVGDRGVVLDIVVAVKIRSEFFGCLSHENVSNELLNEGFVCGCLVEVFHVLRSVDHRVSAGICGSGCFDKVVPVFDNPTIFEAEDVETNLRTEEIVVGVREDEVAVLEGAYVISEFQGCCFVLMLQRYAQSRGRRLSF